MRAKLLGGERGWIIQVPKEDKLTDGGEPAPEGNPEKDEDGTIKAKRMLRDDGMANYNTTDNIGEISLKPNFKNDGRTYTFVDANSQGQCSQDTLESLRAKLPGSMRIFNDNNRSLKYLISKIRNQGSAMLVRYHFFDCASGLTPARYHGLLCLADQGQRTERSPIWEACGYVDEVVSRRRG